MHSGASGMAASELNLDTIANNLANAGTTGFKRTRANFEDLFYQYLKPPGAQDAASKLAPIGVGVGLGTQVSGTQLDFNQGNLKTTTNPYDIAIVGNGFFQVQDGAEILYTRAGNLNINTDQDLVIASAGRGRLLEPAINIPQGTTMVSISSDGTVTATAPPAAAQQVGQIQLANFVNPQGLIQRGENLYAASDASGTAQVGAPDLEGRGKIRQNALETSNVEPVTELVELIKTQRNFELNSQIQLVGIGLVVGLDGTGDGGKSAPTVRALAQVMKLMNSPVADINELKEAKNVAVVHIEARIPRTGLRYGQKIDCFVSSAMGATSLRGGRLLVTPVEEADINNDLVVGLASGGIRLEDSQSLRTGKIPGGIVLHRDYPVRFIDRERGNMITLMLNPGHASFYSSNEIAEAVNLEFRSEAGGTDVARPAGPGFVEVLLPKSYENAPVKFVATMLSVSIEHPHAQARVVVNARTGTVIVTGEVEISPVLISKNGLQIQVQPAGAGGGTATGGFTAFTRPPSGIAGIIMELSSISSSPQNSVGPAGNGSVPASARQNAEGSGELRDAFQKFVAGTFYKQMMKSMRKMHDKPAYFHGGQAEEMFQSQMDQYVTEDLAAKHGAALSEPLFDVFATKLNAMKLARQAENGKKADGSQPQEAKKPTPIPSSTDVMNDTALEARIATAQVLQP
eukprot:g12533.t1